MVRRYVSSRSRLFDSLKTIVPRSCLRSTDLNNYVDMSDNVDVLELSEPQEPPEQLIDFSESQQDKDLNTTPVSAAGTANKDVGKAVHDQSTPLIHINYEHDTTSLAREYTPSLTAELSVEANQLPTSQLMNEDPLAHLESDEVNDASNVHLFNGKDDPGVMT